MAYDESLKSISLDSDSSIAFYTGFPGARGSLDPNGGKQYHFVDITGLHQVGLCATGARAVGVLQNKPQIEGEAATVGIYGVSWVVAGSALAPGDFVSCDANSQATKTVGAAATLGRVLIGAGAGEIASVLLRLS